MNTEPCSLEPCLPNSQTLVDIPGGAFHFLCVFVKFLTDSAPFLAQHPEQSNLTQIVFYWVLWLTIFCWVETELTICLKISHITLIMESLLKLEENLVQILQWPSWAIRLNGGLIALVATVWMLQQLVSSQSSTKSDGLHSRPTWAFRRFQLQYLSVYLITMLADWLQGTHMYTLYQVCAQKLSALSLHFLSTWMIVLRRSSWNSVLDRIRLQCCLRHLLGYLR